MELEQYQKIVRKNAAILSHCLATGTTDFSDIVYFDGHDTARLSSLPLVMSKGYDIIGCVAIGAIPSPELTGADGYFRSSDGTMVALESKLSRIKSQNIFVGVRGGLYASYSDANQPNKRLGVTSKFQGIFDASMTEETLASKSRYTALLLFDEDANAIIDAFVMCPERVGQQLAHRRGVSKTLTLKLGCFLQHGAAAPMLVPYIGWQNWCDQQTQLARAQGRVIA